MLLMVALLLTAGPAAKADDAKPSARPAKPAAKAAANEPIPDGPEKEPHAGAQITRVELRGPPKAAASLQLTSPNAPYDLAAPEGKPKSGEKPTWNVQFVFRSATEELTLLTGKQAAKIDEGKATLTIPVSEGANTIRLTAIDPTGEVTEFDLLVQTESFDAAAGRVPEPKAFLVVGPVAYTRSISRAGTAVKTSNQGSSSAMMAGVRGIYRRRVAKELTDRLLGKVKSFADISATLGKTLSGDPGAEGMPRWADLRLTLEFLERAGFRLEGGAGFSYFSGGLSTTVPGDVDAFFGFLLSARVAYPLSKSLSAFAGVNAALPSAASADTNTLVSQPLEAFLAFSIPRGESGFWELRLKYYQIATKGTVVAAGSVDRKESFIGPELFMTWKF
jgi:hypothetical protein